MTYKLFQILFLFVFIGCSGAFRSNELNQNKIPPSNIHVSQTAIKAALENSGIPQGNGTGVVCNIDGATKADYLLDNIASEYLLGHGYRVFENKKSIPEIRFNLDTLYVNLDIKRKKKEVKLIQRYSEARISVVFLLPSGVKEVYKGRGTYEDAFPFKMLDSTGKNEPFVTYSPVYDRIAKKAKPFLLGITMTALAWLLYSYRG
ncbi:MAG TPA: hypothetical protein ENH82_02015 [bacterium]|nr:hypothetical protein [bacterium]